MFDVPTDLPTMSAADDLDREVIVAATRDWLEKAVIGLGLCPFAASAYRSDRIRFQVSVQESTEGLLQDLARELLQLQSADPLRHETTLLIHPLVLNDFADYNQFLDEADATVLALGLEGELQIASFHPAYQFAGSGPDEIENYTNRAPYPLLHLLRESSVTHAAATFPGVAEISDRNMATLRALGELGWRRLWTRRD
jgi:hypothetical protein